jgi:hypothetical protein
MKKILNKDVKTKQQQLIKKFNAMIDDQDRYL